MFHIIAAETVFRRVRDKNNARRNTMNQKGVSPVSVEGMLSTSLPRHPNMRGWGAARTLTMAARILHFGTDDCKRLLVLNHFGYSVDVRPTLREFRSAIRQRADTDAVLVAAEPSSERRQVVTLTREISQARLILFDHTFPMHISSSILEAKD